MIDCSNQKNKYLENWLGKQKENLSHLYYGGYGETLLISKGEVLDCINNPSEIGLQANENKKVANNK
jgi:hypothetical protein